MFEDELQEVVKFEMDRDSRELLFDTRRGDVEGLLVSFKAIDFDIQPVLIEQVLK